jgi:tRNA A-37 threonylcarbamoyl transferase component Bud32
LRPGKNEPGGIQPVDEAPDTLPAVHSPRADCLSDDEVLAYASGSLPRDLEEPICGHLYTCASCAVLVAEATRGLTTQPGSQTSSDEASTPAERPRSGPTTLSVGEVLLGRYRVVRFVARGGMGEVYEAHDSVLKETVALKTLVCTALDNPTAMSRFLAEVRTARHVTHRNICRILEFGFHHPRGAASGEQVPFLTMEFLNGETLAARIARKGSLSTSEVSALLPQIVAGVSAIHAAGIVHRDIKPQNIVILPGSPERVVVTDFGLARVLDAERSLDTGPFTVGTVDYMSPEQIEGRPPTPGFDVYALGVVLFEMLTGRRPFDVEGFTASQRLIRAAPDPSAVVRGLDRGWDQLVAGCLARDPSRRFARVEDIVPPAPAPPSRWSLPRGPRILARTAAMAVVLLAVLAAIQVARGRLELWPGRLAALGPQPGSPRPRGFPPARPVQRAFAASGCSPDMVAVTGGRGRFCIDRFEASVVDDVQERPLSPHYPPWGPLARAAHRDWSERLGEGRAGPSGMALPPILPYQVEGRWLPRAVSRPGVIPQGYVSQLLARAACTGAGKRLCTEAEWRTACGGQSQQPFLYGAGREPDRCNIARDVHPALVLHGAVHPGVLGDPRLNAVATQGKLLLEPTGARPQCHSRWGDDQVHDMVGNLEEWVDSPQPVALGGFYARSVQQDDGCQLRNDRHEHQGPTYYNYAVGFRCCDQLRSGTVTPGR